MRIAHLIRRVLGGLGWFLLGVRAVAGVPGLTVDAQGALLRDGVPFRGVGVNYFDLFSRTLADPAATNHLRQLKELTARDIPFVRFMAGGYWPSEMALWRTNRVEYLARFQRVLTAAEQAGIGLVPSLCWHISTVPDLVGEPVGAWGDPASRTHAWMREYVREIVRAAGPSPAIWAWEFGNEYNLPADLPNAAEHRPPVVPALGTPTSRSARDELTHEAIRTAIRAFGQEIRRHDTNRLVLSGNAFPRKSAWHQMRNRTWDTDTMAQWKDMLRDDNPAPLDGLSGRLYSADDLERLPWAQELASELRRPLFVGEFGVPGPDTPQNQRRFGELVDALERAKVPLAALWVFDFAGQSDEWSVTLSNDRQWQLEAVTELNRRWRK